MKKIAIVTGAMGGIGYATVTRLYNEGYRVMFSLLCEALGA